MTFKDWLKTNKYWLIGGLIGGLFAAIPIILNPIIKNNSLLTDIVWSIITIPTSIISGKLLTSQFQGWEGLAIGIYFYVALILWITIGAIIGQIIQKVKSK